MAGLRRHVSCASKKDQLTIFNLPKNWTSHIQLHIGLCTRISIPAIEICLSVVVFFQLILRHFCFCFFWCMLMSYIFVVCFTVCY